MDGGKPDGERRRNEPSGVAEETDDLRPIRSAHRPGSAMPPRTIHRSTHQAENERDHDGLARLLDRLTPDSVVDKRAFRRRIGQLTLYGLSLTIFVLAVGVLARTFMNTNIAELRRNIAATSDRQIASALVFTCLSFLALTGYDALALRQLRLRVPYSTTALASFTSYAVSFTLGFPVVTAGTVRYWIYSGKGLSAGKVASLTVIAGITFWLGMALVIGLGFIVRAQGIAHIDHLSPWLNRLIGGGVIAMLGAYLVWAGTGRRQAKIRGFKLELPGLWLTIGQICLGLIDLCSASAVLYALLAPPRSVDYLTFVAVYVFGSLLGIVSNSPGGLGVFEATMLKMVPAPSLFAALLMFRVIYYLLPFFLALALLGTHEAFRRWSSLRAAMSGDADDDCDGDTVG